jgi:Zn-dependent oligopeptidase
MQEPRFNELESRAAQSNLKDFVNKLETETRVHDVIEEMKAEDKILTLSEEEETMLRSFRRFKLRMRKNGEVFTWQTTILQGVTLHEETGLILHPSEVPNK